MVLAVASIASLMMSAALFGRRSKKGTVGPFVPPASEGRPAPSGPNVFAPEAAAAPPIGAPAPAAEPVPSTEVEHAVPAAPPLVDPASQPSARTEGEDQEHDGLLGGPLLAELEARSHSNHPAPHPVRPQEMWHPGVTPQPVDLPPPPVEERIDQAELEGIDGASGRFRFNRLRRVSPGEAPAEPLVVSDAQDTAPDVPVGDVLFGELFTSDRVPTGAEGLGSGAAPLVPRSGGASGSLINGPVGRNPRSSGRSLRPLPEARPQILVADPPVEASVGDEFPAPAPAAPSDDPVPDPVDERAQAGVDDHDADPVVEPTDAAEQEPEPRHGSDEAQVDVATEAEIDADPLVARNVGFDAQR